MEAQILVDIMLLLMTYWYGVSAIIGYDCRHPKIETTVLDAVSVAPCSPRETPVRTTMKQIQLLQRDPLLVVPVLQCHISVTLLVTRCGVWGHVVHTHVPIHTFIDIQTYSQCNSIIESKLYKYNGHIIATDVAPGASRKYHKYLVGHVNSDGSCEGGYFTIGDYSYEHAVVYGEFKVQVDRIEAALDLTSLELHVKSLSTVCPFKGESCMTHDNGQVLWEKGMALKTCEEKKYEVLYTGYANFTTQDGGAAVVSLNSEDTTFSLIINQIVKLCTTSGYSTEHPRLFITEVINNFPLFSLKPKTPLNVNLISYINTKIVFVERHISDNIKSLYRDVVQQRCELERVVISNQLALAYISSDEFAYSLKQGPGYSALTRGEAVHLIKCVPVEVVLRPTIDKCFNEAIVLYKNRTYYLSPRNRLLKEIGTEYECNHLVPIMFRLTQQDWYSLYPTPTLTRSPQVLNPNPVSNWTYTSLHGLAVAGIYSLNEVEALQKQLLFSGEKEALDDSLVRKFAGERISIGVGDASNLFTDVQMTSFFKRGYDKITTYFFQIGNITSGLMGLFVTGKLIVMMIDWVINYLMLRQTFGACHTYSLAFCCNALTAFFLHKNLKSEQSERLSPDSVPQTLPLEDMHSNGNGTPLIPHVTAPQMPSDSELVGNRYSKPNHFVHEKPPVMYIP